MKDVAVFLDVRTGGSEALYYQAARKLDLTPIVISQWPWKYTGVSAADRCWTPDLDPEVILPILERIGRERIAGFVATTSDRVELAARLSIELGRPHPDLKAISICNDKGEFRSFLRRNDLPNVEFTRLQDPSDAYEAARSLGGRTVVKPLAGTGSRHVRVCMTAEEAHEHARFLLGRRNREILMEEYIDAPHYTIDIFNGKSLLIIETHIMEGAHPVLTGTYTPAALSETQYHAITSQIEKIVERLGLTVGPAMAEIRFDGNRIYPIEINPRLGLWSPMSICSSTGIDIAEECVRFACGIPSDLMFPLDRSRHTGSAIRHLVADGGGVRAVRGVEKARRMPNVKRVELFKNLFIRFGHASHNADRIGFVYCTAKTADEASDSAENAIRELEILYEPYVETYFKYRKIKFKYAIRNFFYKNMYMIMSYFRRGNL